MGRFFSSELRQQQWDSKRKAAPVGWSEGGSEGEREAASVRDGRSRWDGNRSAVMVGRLQWCFGPSSVT